MTRPPLVQAPLVVAVTGHRDLREEDNGHLEQKVKDVFLRLRQQYPFTPLLVLSPLAEGADRLVARVALAPEIGARLVVPLPMPVAEYEVDFQEPGSREEFRSLLEQADFSFEIMPAADPDAIRSPGTARNQRYEAVGIYIARQSQILIALWDGADTGKMGGTWAVVKFQTEGIRDSTDVDLQPPELFPVFHILTPRKSNPKPAGEPFCLTEIYPPVFHRQGLADDYYARLFHNLDEFNRPIAEGSGHLTSEAARSQHKLLGDFDETTLSDDEALSLRRYAISDALAHRLHGKMLWAHRALHGWVFTSFLCFVLFAHAGDFHAYWLFLALLFLGIGLVTHKRARKAELDNKCQDYRAVAEGARVRLFWKIAGIEESVPDHYLDAQRTELDWIRNGLRGWDLAPKTAPAGAFAGPGERIEFVRKHWVDAERHYFREAAKKNLESLEWIERCVNGCMALTFALAGGLAALALADYFYHWGVWECPTCEWLRWPVIAIDLGLAGGALLHHFSQRMAYSEHEKQYSRMEAIFDSASRIIRERIAANDLPGARTCLKKLGKEALAENGQWVLLHRERPLELPHP